MTIVTSDGRDREVIVDQFGSEAGQFGHFGAREEDWQLFAEGDDAYSIAASEREHVELQSGRDTNRETRNQYDYFNTHLFNRTFKPLTQFEKKK